VGQCPDLDERLGLDQPISRRDFLDGVLLTSADLFLAGSCPFPLGAQGTGEISSGWTGYTGEGDDQAAAGNTEAVIQNAHAVRDGRYEQSSSESTETGEVYDCVVVGGGFAGLSAGLFFSQQAGPTRNCLILDNARIFGGVAKRNEFVVDGHRLFAWEGNHGPSSRASNRRPNLHRCSRAVGPRIVGNEGKSGRMFLGSFRPVAEV